MKFMKTAAVSVLSICAILLILYICNFWGLGLSPFSDDWGAFGDYFGSITGFLAFAGVLYTAYLSEKRFQKSQRQFQITESKIQDRFIEERDRSLFFQLLDLHKSKFEGVTYFEKDGEGVVESIYQGARAFEKFTEEANELFLLCAVYKHIIDDRNDQPMIDTSLYNANKSLKGYILGVICNKRGRGIESTLSESQKTNEIKTLLSKYLSEDIILNGEVTSIDKNFILRKAEQWFSNIVSSSDDAFMHYCTKKTADAMYKKYGHILGHYFRNMYYVMHTINEFEKAEYYKKVFRAQISRYEIALGVYNALSSRGKGMIIYLEEFNIFKEGDLYPDDLKYLSEWSEIKCKSKDGFVKPLLEIAKSSA